MALLVVLAIVMTVTILSLGFLSRSNVELACGENMILHAQMDSLAESGVEHAKGLILNPQDIDSEYWTGATAQQLVAGSNDYYDMAVARDESNPNNRCNYIVDCNSYRLKGGEQIGRGSLTAELRLDPCVALWTKTDTTIWNGLNVYGDVYCGGTLMNNGSITGDAFSVGAVSNSNILVGKQSEYVDVNTPLGWPRVTVADFTSRYGTVTVTGTLSGQALGPYDPARVCYSNGDLVLAGNVQIDGMLLVRGNLTIQGAGNVITAAKNLPALFVTGEVQVKAGASLQINGLAVLHNHILINGDASLVNVLGGLFVQQTIGETAEDASGSDHAGILCYGPLWRPSGGQAVGALEFDGVDDVVRDPGAGSYLNGLSAVTVSLWVKSDVTDQDRGIFFTADEPTLGDSLLGLRYDRRGAYGGGIRCIKASVGATSGSTQIESASYVHTTAWQHLGLVWESGSSVKLYINGLLDSPTYDRGPVSGTVSQVQQLLVGHGAKSEPWDGLIDDVRIYDRALDANDIYPPVDGLPGEILHWRLDERGCNVAVTAAPTKAAVVVWSAAGARENWGQAAGAFFRSIKRR